MCVLSSLTEADLWVHGQAVWEDPQYSACYQPAAQVWDAQLAWTSNTGEIPENSLTLRQGHRDGVQDLSEE